MWTLIPLPYRAGLILLVVAALFGAGYRSGLVHERDAKDAEIAKLQTAYADRIATAQAAKDAAEAKVAKTEHEAAVSLAAADTKHSQEIRDANLKTTAAVAALRAGTDSLRYRVPANTGSRGPVGGSPATASGSDGGTVATLPNQTAGDLLALAGEADAVVLQLKLAQDTIRTYYKACGPQ